MPKRIKEERMALVSFHLPRQMLECIDRLVKLGVFSSRSEAIRSALRELCKHEMGAAHQQQQTPR